MCRMRALGRRKKQSIKLRWNSTLHTKKADPSPALRDSDDRHFVFSCVLILQVPVLPMLLEFYAFEVTAEAGGVYAMLREKVCADENYRDVVGVAGEEDGIIVNIHFLQARA